MRTTMASEGLKMRHPAASAPANVHPIPAQEKKTDDRRAAEEPHPGGAIKHGTWVQAFRAVSFFVYFIGNCTA
jgi:lysocardiolipin and lysophospholipid acyltransferase